MFLYKLVLLSVFPIASVGIRSSLESQQGRDLHLQIEPFYGVPDLDVFYTTNADAAAEYITKLPDAHEFGLFVKTMHTTNPGFFPERIALLGISRGNRVLLFDLRSYLREVPFPLPASITSFLENTNNTFFGLGIKKGASRIAFEFDAVIKCVDYGVRAWPELKRSGGIYGMFNRYISDIDLWKPDNLITMASQARHAYLQWSVAHYFMMFQGPPQKDWAITKAELFASGPVYLRVPHPKHDWSKERDEWMSKGAKKAAFSIMSSVKKWRKQVTAVPSAHYVAESAEQDMLEQQQPEALQGIREEAPEQQGVVW